MSQTLFFSYNIFANEVEPTVPAHTTYYLDLGYRYESKYEYYYLGEDRLGIYDKENEKFYYKSYMTDKYNELYLDEENLIE